MQAVIQLPRPISVNNLFANKRGGGGRVTAPKYQRWQWEAKALLASQRPLPKFTEPVQITLYIGTAGVSPKMDTDNTCKAYLDTLKSHGIVQDDSRKHIPDLRITWRDEQEGCMAHIRPVGETEAITLAIEGVIS